MWSFISKKTSFSRYFFEFVAIMYGDRESGADLPKVSKKKKMKIGLIDIKAE